MYKTRTAWEFDWQQRDYKRYAIVIEIEEFSDFEEADYFCSHSHVTHDQKSDYLSIYVTKPDGIIKVYEASKEQITLYQFTPESELSFIIKDDFNLIDNDEYEISELPEQFERQVDYEILNADGEVVYPEPVEESKFKFDDRGSTWYSSFAGGWIFEADVELIY
jgi:hypothetical protein